MIPGTTPTFVLTLKNADGYLENTSSLRVDIRQQDVFITKSMQDLVIDTETNSVAITLTQQESNKFQYKNGKIEFQLHGLLNDGQTAWKSYVVDTSVDRALSKIKI